MTEEKSAAEKLAELGAQVEEFDLSLVEYAIPEKECCDSEGCCTEDPCEMFSRIPFPARQFTPTGCDRKKETPCDQD